MGNFPPSKGRERKKPFSGVILGGSNPNAVGLRARGGGYLCGFQRKARLRKCD